MVFFLWLFILHCIFIVICTLLVEKKKKATNSRPEVLELSPVVIPNHCEVLGSHVVSGSFWLSVKQG